MSWGKWDGSDFSCDTSDNISNGKGNHVKMYIHEAREDDNFDCSCDNCHFLTERK